MEKTIVATITPAGRGAISAIRLSGNSAISIAEKLFSKPVESSSSHKALYGTLQFEGKVLDEVLLLPMKAPNSYTGEDVVEIFCHGSPLVVQEILDAALKEGAELAKEGEFTLRAFKNGKLDLAQAEAVQSLIAAENTLAAASAKKHLQGALSKKIQTWQKKLTDIGAIFLAAVDFPEEGLSFAENSTIALEITAVLEEISSLIYSFTDGQKIEEGARISLTGLPNAGKSSLLNALLRKERAIVTEIPGTTRDLFEEKMQLGACHFSLIDTAGIREDACLVEKEGIKRAEEMAQAADFLLFVKDATKAEEPDPKILAKIDKKKVILVWNKADLRKAPKDPNYPHQLQLSAKTGEGIEQLEELLTSILWKQPPESYPLLLTQKRHYLCLKKAHAYLLDVLAGLKEERSFEFLSIDMNSALFSLSEVIGTTVTEDLLSSLFAQFCVGK